MHKRRGTTNVYLKSRSGERLTEVRCWVELDKLGCDTQARKLLPDIRFRFDLLQLSYFESLALLLLLLQLFDSLKLQEMR